jgi:hypothetical protein
VAIRSHFFEFLPAVADNRTTASRPLTAHELTAGERYRVVVTTDGGLYRYQLHDEIEVAGFHRQVPLLRFIGKTDEISDIVGEKLHAAHVQSVLKRGFDQFGMQPTFSQLCVRSSAGPGYVLQVAAAGLAPDSELQSRLRETVDRGLEANPAYKYARAMGQLQPLQLEFIGQHEAEEITARGVAQRLATGQRLGNIKPTTLQPAKHVGQ